MSKTCTFKTWKCNNQRQGAVSASQVSVSIDGTAETTTEIRVPRSDNDQDGDTTETTTEIRVPRSDNDQDGGTTETAAEIRVPRSDNDQDGGTTETTAEIRVPRTETTNEAVIRMDVNELVDIMGNVEDQVDQIIRELRQDPDLQRIMHQAETQQQEDEGIDINPLDDIEYDIEPFDFELEVENYTW